MTGVIRRIRSAWDRHGAAGFVRLCGKNARYYLDAMLQGRLLRRGDVHVSEFDRNHQTDTDRIREVGSLDIDSDNARHAVRYQPSPPHLASEIIASLGIDYRRFTFLDFGAGKGRVLIIAAGSPFASVIGIEFSRELCSIALQNIGAVPKQNILAGRVECQWCDVTTFELPDCPLVCYFYNPFDAVVMRAVMDRLTSSLGSRPREVYVAYVDPDHRALFDTAGLWDVVAEKGRYVIYRANLSRIGDPARA